MQTKTRRPVERRVEAVRAFNFAIDGIGWRECRLSRSGLADARREFPIYSIFYPFAKPIDDPRFSGHL